MRGNMKVDPSCGSVEQGDGAVGGFEDDQKAQDDSCNDGKQKDITRHFILKRSQSCTLDQDKADGVTSAPNKIIQSKGKQKKKNTRSQSSSSFQDMEQKNNRSFKSFDTDSSENSKEPGRLMKFIKRTFSGKRGKRQTAVQEIHIAPDEDDKWASRASAEGSTGSGNNSRASSGASHYSSRENSNLEVVHDMRSESNALHGPWQGT